MAPLSLCTRTEPTVLPLLAERTSLKLSAYLIFPSLASASSGAAAVPFDKQVRAAYLAALNLVMPGEQAGASMQATCMGGCSAASQGVPDCTLTPLSCSGAPPRPAPPCSRLGLYD